MGPRGGAGKKRGQSEIGLAPDAQAKGRSATREKNRTMGRGGREKGHKTLSERVHFVHARALFVSLSLIEGGHAAEGDGG